MFDAEASLADIDSPEAELLDGSVVVTIPAGELLGELLDLFVSFKN